MNYKFLESFEYNYPGVCDGCSAWVIDCRKLDDPDCDEKSGIHVDRNLRMMRSTMGSKDYHELHSRLYDGMSQFLSGENVVIMICKNGRRRSVANAELWSKASEVDDHVVPRRVRRLRIMGTQPTAEDPRSSNRFSALDRDSDTETIGNSWEGTFSESETESSPDTEFRVEEQRTVQAVEFSLRGECRAAFASLHVFGFELNFRRQGKRYESCPFLDAWSFPRSIATCDERGCSRTRSE